MCITSRFVLPASFGFNSSMARAISPDQFIAKARHVHGNCYDYAKTRFINTKTKVTVSCPKHGEFSVTPDNHMRGRGCPACGREKQANSQRKDGSTFIADARAVHGGRYDYSKANYQQARANVEIICPEHGSFWQTPDSHLQGKGCGKCRDQQTSERCRSTTDEFVQRAKERFGDRFNYSQVTYVTAWEPVTISCVVHGAFQQAPITHLQSIYGCPRCAHSGTNRERRLTQDSFLRSALEVHGDKYDYSQVNCIDAKHKVVIICRKHGTFIQTASDHLAGKGCRQCGNADAANRRRKSQEKFIAEAMETHGDKYDYSLLQYVGAQCKVKIICPYHGVFEQTPNSHLKQGCRKCADEELPGAYSLKVLLRDSVLAATPAILYYLQFESDSGEIFYKIGITKTTVAKRFAGYAAAGYRIKTLGEVGTTLLGAFKTEQHILKSHCGHSKHRPLKGNRGGLKFGGWSECFSSPLPRELLNLFE